MIALYERAHQSLKMVNEKPLEQIVFCLECEDAFLSSGPKLCEECRPCEHTFQVENASSFDGEMVGKVLECSKCGHIVSDWVDEE